MAKDDPLVSHKTFESIEKLPDNVHVYLTDNGGHLGYLGIPGINGVQMDGQFDY